MKIIYFSQMLDIFSRSAVKHLVFSAFGKKLFLSEINEVFSTNYQKEFKIFLFDVQFLFFPPEHKNRENKNRKNKLFHF